MWRIYGTVIIWYEEKDKLEFIELRKVEVVEVILYEVYRWHYNGIYCLISLRYNAKKKSYANTIFKKIYGKDNNRCIIYMCNRRFVCTCCFYLVFVE